MLNMLWQALYSMALPIGIGALASFLLTKYASAPGWIWAILLTLGTIVGLISMVKYLLSASAGLERLEKQQAEAEAEKAAKEELHKRLDAELTNKESKGDVDGK